MKSILTNNLRPEKIRILNITPVEKRQILSSRKKNQVLFLIPSSDASHKGLNFVKFIKIYPQQL